MCVGVIFVVILLSELAVSSESAIIFAVLTETAEGSRKKSESSRKKSGGVAKKSNGEEEETVLGQIVRLFTPSPKNSTIIFPNGWKRIYLKKKKKQLHACGFTRRLSVATSSGARQRDRCTFQQLKQGGLSH